MTWHWYGVKLILQAMLTKISDIIWWSPDYSGLMHLGYCWFYYGLSPVRHRAINSSNADFVPIIPPGMYFNEMLLKRTCFYSWKFIWNAVCKLSAILAWCQRVDESLINSKLGLVEVMAWSSMVSYQYLNQIWPKCLTPYGTTRLQWPQTYWLPFARVMICRPLGTKPLTPPMLTSVIKALGNTSWCHVVLNSNVLMRENKIETTFCKLSIILFRSQQIYNIKSTICRVW